ncbi:MAG: cytochrome C, partial [Proteobacteria bacterium]|nr:cytochrome C [Pseudomonadota bacterium]
MRWLLLVLLLMFGTAQAQTLESALMPGAVIAGHAKTEHECGKCHARGERAAQPALCLDCHKPVAADVKSGQGYHGRLKDKTCRSCHTEHKGREAKIVKLDTKTFDHNQTDFALKGKHLGRECASCHKKGETWSKAPAECVACHRKDDKHKNGLGEKCANCHNDGNWKDARFDHAKTKFPLRLAHTEAKCADC